MEHDGWVAGRWVEKLGERRRRHYRLTQRGRAVLAEQRREWAAYTAAVDLVIARSHA